MTSKAWGLLFLVTVLIPYLLRHQLVGLVVWIGEIAWTVGCAFLLIDLALFVGGIYLYHRFSGPIGGLGLFIIVMSPLVLLISYRRKQRPTLPPAVFPDDA